MDQKRTYLHAGVALLLGLVIAFGLHPANGLTALGVRVLAVTCNRYEQYGSWRYG